MRFQKLFAMFLALGLLAVACGDDDTDPTVSGDGETETEDTTGEASDETEDAAGEVDPELAAEVIEHYSAGVLATYEAALTSATSMDTAVDAFVADPSDATLTAAKDAWLAARDDYGLTEAFRFYGGPIDDEDGPEGQLNAWPMDEAYVDYVEGDPDAGIVNDPEAYPTIDADLLVSLNEEGGETNIATGYHAIEFLLWGQDLSADGPGQRPVTDYATAPNADRRATYLTVASDLLIEDLQSLVDEWQPDTDNYRADFADPIDDAVRNMFYGAAELAGFELASERINVAYTERSQEDEHSCFSDNTTNDVIANATSSLNVITGEYPGGLSGPGLDDLVASVDEDLAAEMVTQAEAAVAAAQSIPAPFDQHLTAEAPDDGPGRTAMLTTIETLEAEAEATVTAAESLGVIIEVG